jgi:hypothetical protein
MARKISRRSVIASSLGVSAGITAGMSYEHRALFGQLVDRSRYGKVPEPVKGLPTGTLGGHEVSRLIIGGNLISGSAHAGELLYQSALMTHYFTSKKIFETWEIAERNGINTTLMRSDPHIIEHYRAYLHDKGGKLQWIAQTAPEQGDPVDNARTAQEHGAFAVYFHGGVSDKLVGEGKVDEIGEVVEGFKKAGIFGGVGAHLLETVQAVEEAGIRPDFYMLTINRVDYLSSGPSQVEAFMKGVDRPWIAFKVLGAGRDKPEEGFRHAFRRGADFIAVGMFDWQTTDDAAMVKQVLSADLHRQRLWRS